VVFVCTVNSVISLFRIYCN